VIGDIFDHLFGSHALIEPTTKNEILVSVNDNGVGISPKRFKGLFRIDESDSTTGTNNERGTGLGLILCKEFVEKNNGKICVESRVNKGITFYVELPASNS
jgi:signal transduction histidine kinase